VPFELTVDRSLAGARIVGIGAAQPAGVVTGDELVAPFGKSADWLRERTGIKSLRRLAPDEQLLDFAVAGGVEALEDAGLDGSQVDAVLLATCTGPSSGDSLARQVGRALAPQAVAFDVNSVCAGFCYALSSAAALIGVGTARTVLVIGADAMSRIVDPAELGTSILFGDGAGAVVVTAAPLDEQGVGPAAWSSDGTQVEMLHMPPGDRYMRMRGPEVFRWAVEEVHPVAAEACRRAGVSLADIDVFVPHQANLRIIDAVARKLGLQDAVIAADVVESGNTSAASIPVALAALKREGRTKAGQLALLVGFGAGLTIAGQVVSLP
jgi:3-oxoacyl-[acyl-carrier-protein] synthase-3